MINEKALAGGTVGTVISGTGIALSTNDIAMWISIGLSVLGLLVTIISTIIIPLCQNKQVTQKDLDKLIDKIKDTKDDIDNINKED